MTQTELKQAVAKAAFNYVESILEKDTVIGVGTGSTANYFIAELGRIKHLINATVASSEETANQLKSLDIPVYDLNAFSYVRVYVDGADEINKDLEMIKGGGAALTREKIIASVATEFVCIADESKYVDVLGQFPLPVEVIPMARSHVAREIVKLGGDPVYRENCTTDNGNHILDIYNMSILRPKELEQQLNQITGVVTNGLFAQRGADKLILGAEDGIKSFP